MIYQCDVFAQGMHIPLALCERCKARLEKEGASMRCVVVRNSKTKCSQCMNQNELHPYDRRRRVTNL